MSVYSNRATEAAEAADSYTKAVVGLVGRRDPLEILSSTPDWCAQYLERLTESELTTPESPASWNVTAIVRHLADSELVWGVRLRRLLAEDRPRLVGYDQDLWADRLGYATTEGEWIQALDLFTALRRSNLVLITDAPPADLDRVAVHDERGDESLRHMIVLYAGHDLVHRRQMVRVVASVRRREGHGPEQGGEAVRSPP